MAELTIFHYTPKESVIHAMDGRIKLICMILFTIASGMAVGVLDLTLLTVVFLTALIGSKLPFQKLITEMKYFLFLIGIIIVIHSFTVPGTPITNIPVPGLTWEGLISGLFFGWRLILIILISTILTGTTPLSLLKCVIEWFLRPVPFIRETRVATMFSLTFSLIPLIFDQASEMSEAQKARCIEGRKNKVKRIMFLVSPLLFHTLLRADEMVFAMESRCYSEVRTKTAFKSNPRDWLLLLFSLLVCAMVVFPILWE